MSQKSVEVNDLNVRRLKWQTGELAWPGRTFSAVKSGTRALTTAGPGNYMSDYNRIACDQVIML